MHKGNRLDVAKSCHPDSPDKIMKDFLLGPTVAFFLVSYFYLYHNILYRSFCYSILCHYEYEYYVFGLHHLNEHLCMYTTSQKFRIELWINVQTFLCCATY